MHHEKGHQTIAAQITTPINQGLLVFCNMEENPPVFQVTSATPIGQSPSHTFLAV